MPWALTYRGDLVGQVTVGGIAWGSLRAALHRVLDRQRGRRPGDHADGGRDGLRPLPRHPPPAPDRDQHPSGERRVAARRREARACGARASGRPTCTSTATGATTSRTWSMRVTSRTASSLPTAARPADPPDASPPVARHARDTPKAWVLASLTSPPVRPNVRCVTGLIYVVIIALWAAVLIPIWLRRHDQISEVRSTARFSSAMKSLGSQGQVQYATDSYPLDGHAMEMALPPMRSPEGEARMPRPTTARPTTPRPAAERPAEGLDPDYERELVRQAAATRRALVLGALTVLLLVTLVLAIVGVLPRWAPILAALPVVGFVLAASMTASARTERPAERPPGAPRAARDRVGRARRTAAPRRRGPGRGRLGELERLGRRGLVGGRPADPADVRQRPPRLGGAPWHRPCASGRVDRRGDGRDGPGDAQPPPLGSAGRPRRHRPRRHDRGDPRRRRRLRRAPRGQRVGVFRPAPVTCYPVRAPTRGCSAAGSAPRSQRGGQGFESPQLHHVRRARDCVPGPSAARHDHAADLTQHPGQFRASDPASRRFCRSGPASPRDRTRSARHVSRRPRGARHRGWVNSPRMRGCWANSAELTRMLGQLWRWGSGVRGVARD